VTSNSAVDPVASLLQHVVDHVQGDVTTPDTALLGERVRRARLRRNRVLSGGLMVVLAVAAATIALSVGATRARTASTIQRANTTTTIKHPRSRGRITLLAATSPTGVPRVLAALASDGSGWSLTTAGLELTNDGGQSFSVVSSPIAASNVTDVVVSGSDVTVAGVTSSSSGGFELQTAYSLDDGSTWTEVTPSPPSFGAQAGAAQLVSSGGTVIGMLVTDQTSSAFSQGNWYSTSNDGRTWSEFRAPCGGTVTDVAGDLWLVGGPLNDELYLSTDLGQTWSQVTVPASVASAEAALSVPGALSNGDIVLTATIPNQASGAPEVGVYTSADLGQTWTLLIQTSLPGSIDQGAVTASSVAGGSVWLGAPSGSEVVVVSSNGIASPAMSSAIYSTVGTVDAISGTAAWAIASSSQCPFGKSSCSESTALFETTDGGTNWSQVNLTPSS
jgi:hypothetical protein